MKLVSNKTSFLFSSIAIMDLGCTFSYEIFLTNTQISLVVGKNIQLSLIYNIEFQRRAIATEFFSPQASNCESPCFVPVPKIWPIFSLLLSIVVPMVTSDNFLYSSGMSLEYAVIL